MRYRSSRRRGPGHERGGVMRLIPGPRYECLQLERSKNFRIGVGEGEQQRLAFSRTQHEFVVLSTEITWPSKVDLYFGHVGMPGVAIHLIGDETLCTMSANLSVSRAVTIALFSRSLTISSFQS